MLDNIDYPSISKLAYASVIFDAVLVQFSTFFFKFIVPFEF